MEQRSETTYSQEIAGLRAEVDRLRVRLSMVSDLGARITSSLDLTSVLREVVEASCWLTDARYGALGVFDDEGRAQHFVVHGIPSSGTKTLCEHMKRLRFVAASPARPSARPDSISSWDESLIALLTRTPLSGD